MSRYISEREELYIKSRLINFIQDNFVFEGNPEAIEHKLYDTNEKLFALFIMLAFGSERKEDDDPSKVLL